MANGNNKDMFDVFAKELIDRVLPQVDEVIIKRTEEQQEKTLNKIQSTIEKALKETQLAEAHHSIDDMKDCPECKSKMDKLLEEIEEKSATQAFELGKAEEKVAALRKKAEERGLSAEHILAINCSHEIMSEENKAVSRRFVREVLNSKGMMKVADEVLASDLLNHTLVKLGLPRGPEGMKELVKSFLSAFPDLETTIEDIIAENDRVALRVTFKGTQLGTFRGISPTGKKVAWTGLAIHRLAGGKIVEQWSHNDTNSLIQQLEAS